MSDIVQMMQPIGSTALYYFDAAVFDPAAFTLVDATPSGAITVGENDPLADANSVRHFFAAVDEQFAIPIFRPS